MCFDRWAVNSLTFFCKYCMDSLISSINHFNLDLQLIQLEFQPSLHELYHLKALLPFIEIRQLSVDNVNLQLKFNHSSFSSSKLSKLPFVLCLFCERELFLRGNIVKNVMLLLSGFASYCVGSHPFLWNNHAMLLPLLNSGSIFAMPCCHNNSMFSCHALILLCYVLNWDCLGHDTEVIFIHKGQPRH